MKKPVVDYRQFRLSKLNEPRFSHLKLLFGWVVYLISYLLTEGLIPASLCRSVHCALDDRIPFCEGFLIPYVLWYGLILFSLVYFGLYHIESFRNLSKFILITQAVAVAAYVLFPTRQDLRPEVFPRENLLTRGVALLYRIDTSTGVCPSLHVAISLGIASVWLKQRDLSWLPKSLVLGTVISICLSTMFIKQHSALDVLAALPVGLLAEWIVFRRSRLT